MPPDQQNDPYVVGDSEALKIKFKEPVELSSKNFKG